ncbi:MAG: XTP/dITP diphosphatase [bacterium]
MVKNIIVATYNAHKAREIAQIWSDYNLGLTIVSLTNLGARMELEETGNSFAENALQKALQVATTTSYPVLADDSGLIVDALNGRPGIFSARYAGLHSTDLQNNKKLISELKSIPYEQRKARFKCVMALIWTDKKIYQEEGVCEGFITLQSAGDNGFGYDPYFFLPEYNMTMAQLNPEIKNKISHRAIALRKIAQKIQKLL